MMEEEKEAKNTQIFDTNSAYTQSAFEMRINTEPLVEKIEQFLSGDRLIVIQDEKGNLITKKIRSGSKKMNDDGVEYIISFLSAELSAAVVQGNWDDDWYRDALYSIHEELAFSIMLNTVNWEIDPTKRGFIVMMLMEALRGFLSRLLYNKERDSYPLTVRTVETNTMRESQPQTSRFGNAYGLFKTGK